MGVGRPLLALTDCSLRSGRTAFGVVVPQEVHIVGMMVHQSWNTDILDVGPWILMDIHSNHGFVNRFESLVDDI